jgi:YkoY family integral membrane protein
MVLNVTDVMTILLLVFLEGLLSLDNALVLALLVRVLPKDQQKKALTYGVWGAIGFRFLSLFFLIQIMAFWWIKAAGAIYLLWISLRGLFIKPDATYQPKATCLKFWHIVACVELMDIAFSADSILAAVSLSRNYFVIVIGGALGILTMRMASMGFVKLLERSPRFETTAYLLVLVIGSKLGIECIWPQMDFHTSGEPEGWLFGLAILACLFFGLTGRPKPLRRAHG